MGSISAYKGRQVVDNITWVIAAELLAAARALHFAAHQPGEGTAAAYSLLCEVLPRDNDDRILYRDLQSVYDLLKGGQVVQRVEKAIGEPLV